MNVQSPPDIISIDEHLDIQKVFELDSLPAIDFVLDGLPVGTVGSIVAPGSTGKSFFALEILLDLATGRNFLGMGIKETSKKSLYLTLEDPLDVLRRRIFHMNTVFKLSQDEQNKFIERTDIVSRDKSSDLIHLVNERGEINKQRLNQFKNYLAKKQYRLIIFDTMRRFHGANENDSASMSNLISCFEQIAETKHATDKTPSSAILFLHHTNKTSSYNNTGNQQSAARGSAAITDNVRFQLNLNVPNDKTEYELISDRGGENIQHIKSTRTQYVLVNYSKTNYVSMSETYVLKRDANSGILTKLSALADTEQKSNNASSQYSKNNDLNGGLL